MPARKTRVILFGVGSIGAGIARVLVERPEYQIVAAVDADPDKAGCDLGKLIGLHAEMGIPVTDQPRKGLAVRAPLVIHATGSYLDAVLPELEQIASAGHNIVSTCEELAEPWAENRSAANRLDRIARENDVSIVGTGVNPGFAMDTLPLALSGACQLVERVRVRRLVDAARRRMQLQKKIGTGLSPAAFEERVVQRQVRHVGLVESASLLAKGLGWELDSIQETIEPVLASKRVVTDYFTVDPRFVVGLKQVARGLKGGVEKINLELQMTVDANESTDEVWVDGRPNLHTMVRGIHGDVSTAAMVANAARRVVQARPGLLTMLDLPLVTAR